MKFFRTLNPDEIEVRIAQVKNDPKKTDTQNGVSLLLYKTARTDADILDDKVGPSMWENDFKLVDGVLYGGIGVNYGDGMVWKWDAGTESNTEAEKGRASDAFKRAGFKHGIGRELYSAPFIWIPAKKLKKLDGNKCWDRFTVAAIGYDDREKINYLVIKNQSYDVVFEFGEAPDSIPHAITCEDCFRPIIGVKTGGKEYSASDIAERTMKKYHRFLCHECAAKLAKAEEELRE